MSGQNRINIVSVIDWVQRVNNVNVSAWVQRMFVKNRVNNVSVCAWVQRMSVKNRVNNVSVCAWVQSMSVRNRVNNVSVCAWVQRMSGLFPFPLSPFFYILQLSLRSKCTFRERERLLHTWLNPSVGQKMPTFMGGGDAFMPKCWWKLSVSPKSLSTKIKGVVSIF